MRSSPRRRSVTSKAVPRAARAPAELDDAAREVEPPLLPRLGEDLELVARGHRLPALAGEAPLPHPVAELGVDEVEEAEAQHLVRGVARQLRGGGVHEAELAALVDEDGAGRGLRQGAEARLALAQGVPAAHLLERARHVARDEGQHVEVAFVEADPLVVALHREGPHRPLPAQEGHPQPVDGGRARKLDLPARRPSRGRPPGGRAAVVRCGARSRSGSCPAGAGPEAGRARPRSRGTRCRPWPRRAARCRSSARSGARPRSRGGPGRRRAGRARPTTPR